MDDTPDRLFFLRPSADAQRLYEALRAVFVDGCRQEDAAERFGYGFDAFRRQVHQFRAACAAGRAPPFLPPGGAADRPSPCGGRRGNPTSPPPPTAAP